MSKVIDYHPTLLIRNVENLPKGTGCKLLLVISDLNPNEFIAKRWMRVRPKTLNNIETVIKFD